MNSKKLISAFSLFILVLSGCATFAPKNGLSEFRNTNWSEMDRAKAEQLLGTPDTTGVVYKTSQEALIYFAKEYKAPQLIVVFDKTTNKIQSVHWFANSPADKLTLSQVRSEFSEIQLQDHPFIKDGAWGGRVSVYSSKDNTFEINMDSTTQKLSSLSWQFEADKKIDQRKPTSH